MVNRAQQGHGEGQQQRPERRPHGLVQDVEPFTAGRFDKAAQRDRDQPLEGRGEQGAERERHDDTGNLYQDRIQEFRLLSL